MATANYFEQMAENQKQMMDSWIDYSQKVMKQMQGNTASGEASQELFQEWYHKQKKVMEESIHPHDPQQAMSGAVENYQKMMEIQLAYTQKWMEMSQEQVKQMMPNADNQWGSMFTQGNKTMDEWIAQTNQFIRGQMTPFMPFGMMPRMDSISDAYREMQKYWDPILKSIQSGSINPDMIKNWLSPEFYQGMMGKLTSFNLPETMQTVANHATSMFSDYNQWLSDQASGFTQNFPQAFSFSGESNPWMHMMQEVQARLEKSYAPLSMMNQGKQSKMIDLIREAQSEYINFAVKGTEFQLKLIEAGQKAMPEAIMQLNDQYKQEEKLPDYDAFFNAFVSLLETYLIDIFETDEYASLQNELALAGVKVKNRMDKFMELAFEGAPFTMRSETEELAKEVAELKRKLRSMEKALKEARAEAPAPAASPKKNTASKATKGRSKKATGEEKTDASSN